MLDRHEDMVISGGRNPFLCRYNVGYDENGKIRVLDVTVYNNAGSSRDLSMGVIIILYALLFLTKTFEYVFISPVQLYTDNGKVLLSHNEYIQHPARQSVGIFVRYESTVEHGF